MFEICFVISMFKQFDTFKIYKLVQWGIIIIDLR